MTAKPGAQAQTKRASRSSISSDEDWARFAALVLAPGVPLTHPEPHWTVQKAEAAGVEVIGDIELFCRERASSCPEAPFIAITGTNGKSTTTALIAHILRQAGRDVQLGGNIGRPVLTLDPLTLDRVYVVECSSFQIDLAPTIRPSVGVLLNVTPDHLDRHGTIANYAGVKERLIAGADKATVVIDDDWTRAIAEKYRSVGKEILSASTRDKADIVFSGSTVFFREEPVADLAGVAALRGRHNGENACAAYGALRLAGLRDDEIVPHMLTYPGLRTAWSRSVAWAPRSSSTTARRRTPRAPKKRSPPGRAVSTSSWVARPRMAASTPCVPTSRASPKPTSSEPQRNRSQPPSAVKSPMSSCETMDVAVAKATHDAIASGAEESVVLLSPACASFDQYRNFEERGEHFRRLVAEEIARRTGS